MSTTEPILAEKDEKNLNIPFALYDYLKDRYGIADSETANETGSVVKTIHLSLPQLPAHSSHTAWSIHVEKDEQYDDCNTHLVFGAHWPNASTRWARIIVIDACIRTHMTSASSASSARCRYKITECLLEPEHGDSFAVVTEFMNLMNDFLKQY